MKQVNKIIGRIIFALIMLIIGVLIGAGKTGKDLIKKLKDVIIELQKEHKEYLKKRNKEFSEQLDKKNKTIKKLKDIIRRLLALLNSPKYNDIKGVNKTIRILHESEEELDNL